METIFRLFMYIFPYALSFAAYFWMFRRAQRVPHKTAKAVAIAIVVAGLGYTLYHMATTISRALTDDRFHFFILIITVFVLFFSSIAMAFGEPEK
jgi:heme A synthase